MATEYRALSTQSDYQGPVRTTIADAQKDADAHDAHHRAQGGFARAAVVTRDGDRCATLTGEPVWPSHGRSSGAVRWRP